MNRLRGNALRSTWGTLNQMLRRSSLGTLTLRRVNRKFLNTSTASGEPLTRVHQTLFWLSTSYRRYTSQFDGKAFFLYSTVELAEYAVRKLHDKQFLSRKLWVLISEQRLNVRTTRGNVIGSSRTGAKIWDCVRPAVNREQIGNFEQTGNREQAGNSEPATERRD